MKVMKNRLSNMEKQNLKLKNLFKVIHTLLWRFCGSLTMWSFYVVGTMCLCFCFWKCTLFRFFHAFLFSIYRKHVLCCHVNATDTVDTCKELLHHDCVTQMIVIKVNLEHIQNKMNKKQQKRPLRRSRNIAKIKNISKKLRNENRQSDS